MNTLKTEMLQAETAMYKSAKKIHTGTSCGGNEFVAMTFNQEPLIQEWAERFNAVQGELYEEAATPSGYIQTSWYITENPEILSQAMREADNITYTLNERNRSHLQHVTDKLRGFGYSEASINAILDDAPSQEAYDAYAKDYQAWCEEDSTVGWE